jgi:anaerobic selenocysteine-containing dehydrogenase
MDRRAFIKLTAVSGTTTALAACGDPDHQLIRFVPDEDIIPGQAVWKPGVCPLCPAGCGLTVRVMDADADVVRNGQAGIVQILAAKKLEGNPDHPVNRGGLCARGQAGLQVTYHPDRITQPLKRAGNRGDGAYEAITWEAAIAEVVSKLNALHGNGPLALAFVGRPGESHRNTLIAAFLSRFGAVAPVAYELFGDDVLRVANGISFDREQLPTFDFARSRYVLNFGADILGTWNAPVSHARAYGDMRQGRAGVRGRLVQVEPRMSQTGASADEWLPIRPGTEGVLALGIAHVMLKNGSSASRTDARAVSAIEGWSAGLPDYAPDAVEKVTGVPASRIERIARDFVGDSSIPQLPVLPGVAVIGGAALAHTNGLFNAQAVNALNALVGSVGSPGGLLFTPQFDVPAAAKLPPSAAGQVFPFDELMALAGRGSVSSLFIDGVNPVFTSPRAWKVRDAIAKVPFVVSFGSFLDETSMLADLILPDHSFLESWSESVPESGSATAVVSVAPPVMKPLHDTRATPDVLLEIGRALAKPIELPWQTFEEMLTATIGALPAMTEGSDAWTDAQEKGGWWGNLPETIRLKPDSTRETIRLKPESTSDVESGFSRMTPQFDGDAAEYPFHFLPYPSNQFLDGSLAHLPWLQEMPDPLTSAMWSSWVEINPSTAAKMGIEQGDVVDVTSSHGTVRTAAYLSPGIAPDVLAMPAGQGHTTFTRYASGRGANPVDLLAPLTVAATSAVAWAATRVKIARVGEKDGRLILFAGGMREHTDHGR